MVVIVQTIESKKMYVLLHAKFNLLLILFTSQSIKVLARFCVNEQ